MCIQNPLRFKASISYSLVLLLQDYVHPKPGYCIIILVHH